MVFPYVTVDTLERRLQVDAAALQLTSAEWHTTLDEVAAAESERVEIEEYAGASWRDVPTVNDVPHVIREAVIRLSRARIHEIRSDGLESENTGDNASYNYRPPGEIRAEVREELRSVDIGDSTSGYSLTVSDVK